MWIEGECVWNCEVILNCTWRSYLSINLVVFNMRSRISVCLFCLLETTSVNKFMKSFPKSEYWHFKISWKHCQENLQFSWRDFFGLQDFDISTRSYLTSCRDSRRGFGRLDFRISLRSYLILGEFLAAEILRSQRESRRDFEISARSRRDLGENLGEFLAAEISPRSRQSCRPKTCQKLAEISARSRSKFCRGSPNHLPESSKKSHMQL